MYIGKNYFETGSHVVQAGPKLTMSLQPFALQLLSVEIIGAGEQA